MWWLRIVWLPLVIASLWLLAGALGQQPGPAPSRPGAAPRSAPRPAPPPPPKADEAATTVLDVAIKALDPKKLAWVETTLWQQANLQGLTFRAEGHYLAAPGNRLRLDLQVNLGGTLGKLLVVSDGKTWWERLQVGDNPQVNIQKMDLKTVLATLNSPNMLEQVRTEFFQRRSFTGVEPLLKAIRQQMTVTSQERLVWKDRPVTKLTAEWSEAAAKALIGANAAWPDFLPRRCCLFLDADMDQARAWPHRIEWWGPASAGEVLLLQMEFRNPKLGKLLSDEQYAQQFQFNPGKAPFQDLTKRATEDAKNRRNQLAAQQGRTRSSR
jgi:hypothetical protein